MTEIDFREAIRSALDEELARDERVILFGEDVAVAGGVFAVTPGLQEKYGPARVFDTPISELAMTGAAYGADAARFLQTLQGLLERPLQLFLEARDG